jgi:hypothetical protein
MKMHVKRAAPQTKEELLQAIKTLWNELDGGLLNKLVSSFSERLKMVIRARDRSISPYLSSHRSEQIAKDASIDQDFRPFRPVEDTAILKCVKRIGIRWKRITEILSTQFGPRERMEIKHCTKWLINCQANEAAMELTREAPDRDESPFTPE